MDGTFHSRLPNKQDVRNPYDPTSEYFEPENALAESPELVEDDEDYSSPKKLRGFMVRVFDGDLS